MVEIKNSILRLNGKPLGRVENNKLYMVRAKNRHFYRVLESWCLNVEIVNSGVEWFIINVSEDGSQYRITLDKIKKLRSKVNMFVSFKDEHQLAIPAKCWDCYAKNNMSFPVFIGMPES